jgi:hypothetical protein
VLGLVLIVKQLGVLVQLLFICSSVVDCDLHAFNDGKEESVDLLQDPKDPAG